MTSYYRCPESFAIEKSQLTYFWILKNRRTRDKKVLYRISEGYSSYDVGQEFNITSARVLQIVRREATRMGFTCSRYSENPRSGPIKFIRNFKKLIDAINVADYIVDDCSNLT